MYTFNPIFKVGRGGGGGVKLLIIEKYIASVGGGGGGGKHSFTGEVQLTCSKAMQDNGW